MEVCSTQLVLVVGRETAGKTVRDDKQICQLRGIQFPQTQHTETHTHTHTHTEHFYKLGDYASTFSHRCVLQHIQALCNALQFNAPSVDQPQTAAQSTVGIQARSWITNTAACLPGGEGNNFAADMRVAGTIGAQFLRMKLRKCFTPLHDAYVVLDRCSLRIRPLAAYLPMIRAGNIVEVRVPGKANWCHAIVERVHVLRFDGSDQWVFDVATIKKKDKTKLATFRVKRSQIRIPSTVRASQTEEPPFFISTLDSKVRIVRISESTLELQNILKPSESQNMFGPHYRDRTTVRLTFKNGRALPNTDEMFNTPQTGAGAELEGFASMVQTTVEKCRQNVDFDTMRSSAAYWYSGMWVRLERDKHGSLKIWQDPKSKRTKFVVETLCQSAQPTTFLEPKSTMLRTLDWCEWHWRYRDNRMDGRRPILEFFDLSQPQIVDDHEPSPVLPGSSKLRSACLRLVTPRGILHVMLRETSSSKISSWKFVKLQVHTLLLSNARHCNLHHNKPNLYAHRCVTSLVKRYTTPHTACFSPETVRCYWPLKAHDCCPQTNTKQSKERAGGFAQSESGHGAQPGCTWC